MIILYRKETSQELLAAAVAAYAQAPPAHNTCLSRFGRSLPRGVTPTETSSRRRVHNTNIPA